MPWEFKRSGASIFWRTDVSGAVCSGAVGVAVDVAGVAAGTEPAGVGTDLTHAAVPLALLMASTADGAAPRLPSTSRRLAICLVSAPAFRAIGTLVSGTSSGRAATPSCLLCTRRCWAFADGIFEDREPPSHRVWKVEVRAVGIPNTISGTLWQMAATTGG